jgi:hypothetical protein
LSHFVIELPGCAPELASYIPTHYAKVGSDPLTSIYGIKWQKFVGIHETALYVVTFPGNVPEGTVQVSVQAGPEALRSVESGVLPGSCRSAGDFQISGTVFDDANSDGIYDEVEPGLPDVTVVLEGEGEVIATGRTNADGEYRFEGIAPGYYTVRVPAMTADSDFNEDLAEYFIYTGSTSGDPRVEVSVGPDSEGNDFGFEPDAQVLIQGFNKGELTTTGKSVKYWKDQLGAALRGEVAEIDAATLKNYLDQIETLYLPDPYQFGTGNRLRAALDMLNHKPDAIDWYELREELLAAELNVVHGLGITGAAGLQSNLLAWGETLVATNAPAEGVSGLKISAVTLLEAATVFNQLNGGGSKKNE